MKRYIRVHTIIFLQQEIAEHYINIALFVTLLKRCHTSHYIPKDCQFPLSHSPFASLLEILLAVGLLARVEHAVFPCTVQGPKQPGAEFQTSKSITEIVCCVAKFLPIFFRCFPVHVNCGYLIPVELLRSIVVMSVSLL